MRILCCDDVFATWRGQARALLNAGVEPDQVSWEDQQAPQLFAGDDSDAGVPLSNPGKAARVPPELLKDLETAGCFRMPGRWNLLYRVLWRVAQGERQARLAGDVDGSELQRRIKAVRREAHHLHAFLRFHPCPQNPDLAYIAWHEPAHDVLAWASEHFIGRLGQQSWMIVSPQDAVWFDGQTLDYRRPSPPDWQALAKAVGSEDDALWQTYYASIFNPARVNLQVMRGHMPSRFWAGVPEGKLIAPLVGGARRGARQVGQATALTGLSGKRIRRAAQAPDAE